MMGGRLVLTSSLGVFLAWLVWRHLATIEKRHTVPDFQRRYGDWAIVAGASGTTELGAAWAKHLCHDFGIHVMLIARREEKLKLLQRHLEQSKPDACQVEYLVQDLADSKMVQEQVSELLLQKDRKYGLLVYNAAIARPGEFLNHPLEDELEALDVNVRSVLTLTHIFAKALSTRKQTGGIILMSSMAGEIGTGFVANYAATKSWNTAFSHGLFYELKPLDIDVLGCVAGATSTPNYNEYAGQTKEDFTVQTPEQVVSECTQALGATGSIATGTLNKLVRFLLKVVPTDTMLKTMSDETGRRGGFLPRKE